MVSTGDSRETREFAREAKFLVSAAEAPRLRAWARRVLSPDPHGTGPWLDEYAIATLYFETAAFDVFHRRGSFGRSKLRIRRYGAMNTVFLERKLRTDGLLAKRRTAVPIEELAVLDETPSRAWPGHWFHKRLARRALRPGCRVSYTRMARMGQTKDGPIRLTIDAGLRAAATSRISLAELGGSLVMPDQAIVELKFIGDQPALFQYLADEFQITPQPVSKYRMSMAALEPAALPAAVRPVMDMGDAL